MSQSSQPYPNGVYAKRTLADYRLNYRSERYPLLSFMYAVLAGGEGPIHFDFSLEYNAAYLLAPFGGNIENAPRHVREFINQLEKLELRTEGRTKYVALTSEDWDVFNAALCEELRGKPHSEQFW